MTRPQHLTIGVDVGGTKIAAGAVDTTGRIVEDVRVGTPGADAEGVEAGICEAVITLLDRVGATAVDAVGVAIAGFVDERRSRLRFAPNLPMVDRPLRETVQARVGLPVVVENDANAAAWGEYRFGAAAAREATDVVMVTVGTGIGGGIIQGGRLVRGAFGAAGVFGHIRVVPEGRRCGCGKRGCWEQYTSGRALVRDARDLARRSPDAVPGLLERAGGDPGAITGGMIARAAAAGDASAVALYAEIGRWLGEGLADLADVLDPAVAVIGGGVSEAGELLLGPARAAFDATLSAGQFRPHLRLVAAELGNAAGMVGAADLAREAADGAPEGGEAR